VESAAPQVQIDRDAGLGQPRGIVQHLVTEGVDGSGLGTPGMPSAISDRTSTRFSRLVFGVASRIAASTGTNS
jgi:hypothetical protein